MALNVERPKSNIWGLTKGRGSRYMASRCPELRLSATARMDRRKLHSRTGTFKLHSCAEGEEKNCAWTQFALLAGDQISCDARYVRPHSLFIGGCRLMG